MSVAWMMMISRWRRMQNNARSICKATPTRHLLQDFFGQLALDRGQLTVFLVHHVLLLRKEHRKGREIVCKRFANGETT